MQEEKSIWQAFGNQVEKARRFYQLRQKDVALLAGLSQSEYSKIENGTAKVGSDKWQMVARVYGLHYWELANPAFNLPAPSELPDAIKLVLHGNATSVKPYRKLYLGEELGQILSKMKPDQEFVPSDIYAKLRDELKESIRSPARITQLLNTSFAEYVVKSGKTKPRNKAGRPEEYYKIKSPMNK